MSKKIILWFFFFTFPTFFTHQRAFADNMSCSVAIEPVTFGAYDIFQATPLDAVGSIELFCTATNIPEINLKTNLNVTDTEKIRDDLSFEDDRFSRNPYFTITLDTHQSSQNISIERTLHFGKHRLQYNLFLDASHTLIWGDGTNNTYFHQETLTNSENQKVITIYGRIPAKQIVPPGSYGDSIRVNLEW